MAAMLSACCAGAVLNVAPAAANHLPNTYCSESGDVCQSVAKVDGVRKFRISLAARYFARYDFCVNDTSGFSMCKRFRIERRDNGTFGDTEAFRRHFRLRGGRYTAKWFRLSDGERMERVGARLGFHVR